MRNKIISYGRISSRGQHKSTDRLYQLKSINESFPGAKVDFQSDECGGDTPLSDRSAFLIQLSKAKKLGLPLNLEHPDRLFKSYNEKVIHQGYNRIQRSGVPLRFVHSNTDFHKILWEVLSSHNSDAWKIRNIIRRVEQHLIFRNLILARASSSPGKSPPSPSLTPFKTLERRSYFYLLEECAQLILALRKITDTSQRNFSLDAYLGRVYNRKQIDHKAGRGKRKSFPVGQRSFYERPEDEALFRIIRRLENSPHFTLDGRPKRVSNQTVANYLNSKTQFRNMRGKSFSPKNIFDRRKSEVYRRFCSDVATTPSLPDLDE